MRGSKLRTRTLDLVSLVFFPQCAFAELEIFFLYSLGEVGKLLGAKWKELDDEEKKVSLSAHNYSSYL